jgi:hypothetical protein
MLVKLLPHQQKEIVLNAVCTEKQQSSPSVTDTFSLGPLPSSALTGLSQKLYQLKCFDHTAQQAVWSVTDQSPLSDILDTHSDTLVENVLITYLAEQLKQPKPVVKASGCVLHLSTNRWSSYARAKHTGWTGQNLKNNMNVNG